MGQSPEESDSLRQRIENFGPLQSTCKDAEMPRLIRPHAAHSGTSGGPMIYRCNSLVERVCNEAAEIVLARSWIFTCKVSDVNRFTVKAKEAVCFEQRLRPFARTPLLEVPNLQSQAWPNQHNQIKNDEGVDLKCQDAPIAGPTLIWDLTSGLRPPPRRLN